MITLDQRRAIDAIVSIFETGKLPGAAAFATATILADGAGISYGLHQATAASSLPAVLAEYDRRGGLYAGRIRPYLPQLPLTTKMRPGLPIPEWAELLLELLRAAGSDPAMQAAQREVFDRDYWGPASAYAAQIGATLPLTHLALYDTWIQSVAPGPDARPTVVTMLRGRFKARPPVRGGTESVWTHEFLQARRAWLAGWTSSDAAKQALVRRTVYRVDALLQLVAADRWLLELPLTVRGVVVR